MNRDDFRCKAFLAVLPAVHARAAQNGGLRDQVATECGYAADAAAEEAERRGMLARDAGSKADVKSAPPVAPMGSGADRLEPGCGASSGERGFSPVCTAHHRGEHLATGLSGCVYRRWPIETHNAEPVSLAEGFERAEDALRRTRGAPSPAEQSAGEDWTMGPDGRASEAFRQIVLDVARLIVCAEIDPATPAQMANRILRQLAHVHRLAPRDAQPAEEASPRKMVGSRLSDAQIASLLEKGWTGAVTWDHEDHGVWCELDEVDREELSGIAAGEEPAQRDDPRGNDTPPSDPLEPYRAKASPEQRGPTDDPVRIAGLVLAEPDEERDCLRCRRTMASPDRSDGDEETALCHACAQAALPVLAAEVQRLHDEFMSIAAPDREELGRAVHEVWAAAARDRAHVKPAAWDELRDVDREDCAVVGERLFAMGVQHARQSARVGDTIDATNADPIAARDAMIETLQRDLDSARLEAADWVSRFEQQSAKLRDLQAQRPAIPRLMPITQGPLHDLAFDVKNAINGALIAGDVNAWDLGVNIIGIVDAFLQSSGTAEQVVRFVPRLMPVTTGPVAQLVERIGDVFCEAMSEPSDGELRAMGYAMRVAKLVDEHLQSVAAS